MAAHRVRFVRIFTIISTFSFTHHILFLFVSNFGQMTFSAYRLFLWLLCGRNCSFPLAQYCDANRGNKFEFPTEQRDTSREVSGRTQAKPICLSNDTRETEVIHIPFRWVFFYFICWNADQKNHVLRGKKKRTSGSSAGLRLSIYDTRKIIARRRFPDTSRETYPQPRRYVTSQSLAHWNQSFRKAIYHSNPSVPKVQSKDPDFCA